MAQIIKETKRVKNIISDLEKNAETLKNLFNSRTLKWQNSEKGIILSSEYTSLQLLIKQLTEVASDMEYHTEEFGI